MFDAASDQRLRSVPLAWLTTVRADGQPVSSYIWFHFDGDDIVVFSQPRAAKVRNIAARPRVSLHLDGNTETGGDVLTIDGTAEIIDELPDARWRAYCAKYDSRIQKGPWQTPDGFAAEFSQAIAIAPTRVRAW